ncbi:MAG: hypothetical protein M3R38_19860, partial [Actinomycetota bacterium]|nr:hypothetical protein [Actinomycetota bacterium]
QLDSGNLAATSHSNKLPVSSAENIKEARGHGAREVSARREVVAEELIRCRPGSAFELAPPLNPATREPFGPEAFSEIFPEENIR